MTQFNLVRDPWIPIGDTAVSIREALTKAQELPGWPGGDFGLAETVLRLLVPMVYRIGGLDDAEDYYLFAERQSTLFDQSRFDESAVHGYLEQHVDRFWLIGGPEDAPPFAQDPTLGKVAQHEAAKAVAEWASGNNAVLGPHADTDNIPFVLAAQRLLVLRTYAWGGLHTKHPDHTGKGKFVGGPLRGTMSVHPVGRTLFETLVGHLVPPPGGDTGFGEPFWEQPVPTNPVAAHNGRAGLLEQIAGRQDKTMLLRTNDAGDKITGFTIAEGPGVDRQLFCDDPYLVLDPDREPVKPKMHRAFWRESEALLTTAPKQRGRRNAQTKILDWAQEESNLYAKEQFSWAVISHLGDKSKNLEWDRSTAPDLLRIFDLNAALDALTFMSIANDAETRMARQVAKVWHTTDKMPTKAADKAAVYRSARAEFWKRCEQDFWDAVNNGMDQQYTCDRIRDHALAGFDHVTEQAARNHRALPVIVESRKWIELWERPEAPAWTRPADNQETT
ncbi:MAG: type I-E CRISPR-associated protein Cse1/CasA [Acidimicrobiaceae bacterium]|nr:type I-E CRISPR-associated protein Cse1/CasA [Acidimicrobiia bacterium]MCY4492923.1 type I-E CRISPR-associated protein Cse1/CasA [Acidimicrobiaceae bacterium]